jgi:hypothetical protein
MDRARLCALSLGYQPASPLAGDWATYGHPCGVTGDTLAEVGKSSGENQARSSDDLTPLRNVVDSDMFELEGSREQGYQESWSKFVSWCRPRSYIATGSSAQGNRYTNNNLLLLLLIARHGIIREIDPIPCIHVHFGPRPLSPSRAHLPRRRRPTAWLTLLRVRPCRCRSQPDARELSCSHFCRCATESTPGHPLPGSHQGTALATGPQNGLASPGAGIPGWGESGDEARGRAVIGQGNHLHSLGGSGAYGQQKGVQKNIESRKRHEGVLQLPTSLSISICPFFCARAVPRTMVRCLFSPPRS